MTELVIPGPFRELFVPARYKAYHGGRGGGKSHSFAGALVLMGAQRRMRIGCYREIQKSIATSVKQLLDDKIEDAGLRDFYTSTQFGIVGKNGTQFLFGGLRTNPDAIKSTEGLDVAWIEEADRVSQRSIELLTPTLRKPGSELWASWNRKSVKDPIDNMFLGGEPPPRSVVKQVNWRDNPFFPEELRDEMEWLKRRDHDKWLHVWEGYPLARSESRVFNNWEEGDLDDLVPDDCVPLFGSDWGFSVDPTVLVKCYIWGRTLYIAEEAYKVKCEIDETPALFAGDDRREWLHETERWKNPHKHKGVSGVRNGLIIADSARPETISYMKRHGFNIRGAIKGAKSVEEGVEFVKTLDVVIHPRCKHTMQEFQTYSYKVDPDTDVVLPELEDRHNHVIDAVRYAVEAKRRGRFGQRIATAGVEVVDLQPD
jgi:phage terminase large subunit